MTDSQLLQQIDLHLANIEAISRDLVHNIRIFGFTGLGLTVGGFGSYIFLKEVLKKW
jgi:hypothetical protein